MKHSFVHRTVDHYLELKQSIWGDRSWHVTRKGSQPLKDNSKGMSREEESMLEATY